MPTTVASPAKSTTTLSVSVNFNIHIPPAMSHISRRNNWHPTRKVAGSIPDGAIGIFHWHNPFGRTMATGVDSASNRNEYQEYFLGVKTAGALGR
jgi:hypothetical protein